MPLFIAKRKENEHPLPSLYKVPDSLFTKTSDPYSLFPENLFTPALLKAFPGTQPNAHGRRYWHSSPQ